MKNTTSMAAEQSAPLFQSGDGNITTQENLAYQAANDFITQPNDTYQIGACDQYEVAATQNDIYESIYEIYESIEEEDADANGMKNTTKTELSAPVFQPGDGNLTTEENLAANGVKNTAVDTDMAAEPSAPVFQPDDGNLITQENLAYQAANDFMIQPSDTYQTGICDQSEATATQNEIYESIEEEQYI